VQESLKAFITENRMAAGDPLPPEAELAQALGVGRSSVREAIRALESIGIVESRRGIGVFVSGFSFTPLLDNLAFGLRDRLREIEEILEIRRALETAMIGDAMRAMTPADTAGLQRIAAAMGERAARGESIAEDDQEFHRQLFRAQGNQTLRRLLDVFWEAFFAASGDLALHDRDPVATWRDHAAIAEAIAAGDGGLARERLRQHYDGILRLLADRQPERTSSPDEATQNEGEEP
jgi:DNA-binding FadR family transcriptional regulator